MKIKERTHAGKVTIIGRPSVGKSTLVNNICNAPVSIISDSPQTTRNQIKGIYTTLQGQIVFLDTPGIYGSQKRFNKHLMALVRKALTSCHLILYLIDSTRPPGDEEKSVATFIQNTSLPYILVLNKIDHTASNMDFYHEFLTGLRKPYAQHYISALKKIGLQALIDNILNVLPESELLYPKDVYTDQTMEFKIAEIVRASALRFLRKELPYAFFTYCTNVLHPNKDHPIPIVWVTIYVEQESQKGILVGKRGSMIQKIRCESESQLKKIFPYPIQLHLRVKKKPNWKKNDMLLKKIIY